MQRWSARPHPFVVALSSLLLKLPKQGGRCRSGPERYSDCGYPSKQYLQTNRMDIIIIKRCFYCLPTVVVSLHCTSLWIDTMRGRAYMNAHFAT